MNILVNGKEIQYYSECNNCYSEIEYEFDEIERDIEKYVTCPVCGESIYKIEKRKKEYINKAII